MFVKTVSLYKSSFTGLSRQTWLLSLVMLINRSGTMVVPFMTLYLTGEEMHRSLSDAGTVMGLFGLGAIVGAYFGGRITDRSGFYKVQLFTLFFGGVFFIILGQIKSYPLICLFTFLLSTINEAFRPANSSAVAYFSKPQNRTRSYSLNRLAINLGWAVGTSVGGMLAVINYELLFWVDGFTNIFAALLLLIYLNPGKQKLEKPAEEEKIETVRSAYSDKVYLVFIFLATIFAMCFFQLFTTIPKYFRDDLFLSEEYIGYIMALNGLLIVAVEMVLVYILEQKNKTLQFISSGLILCALAFFSLLLPGNGKMVTLIMILFITAGEILSMPFMNTYWTQRSTASNRGQYAALYTIAWGIGQSAGPFLCSRIAQSFGFELLFIVLGSALLLSSGGFQLLGFFTSKKSGKSLRAGSL